MQEKPKRLQVFPDKAPTVQPEKKRTKGFKNKVHSKLRCRKTASTLKSGNNEVDTRQVHDDNKGAPTAPHKKSIKY